MVQCRDWMARQVVVVFLPSYCSLGSVKLPQLLRLQEDEW